MRTSCAIGATLLLVLSTAIAGARDRSTAMVVSSKATQPHGHWRFCMDNPSECEPDGSGHADPVDLDDALLNLVAQVNRDVNASVIPKSDMDVYGVEERWALPDAGVGDCEDYALLKRRLLSRAGVPLSSLLMTVVRKPDGVSHAVLTLRSNEGDFVLDNLDWVVRPWSETPYTFVKRQSSDDPSRWLMIERPGERQVASANSR